MCVGVERFQCKMFSLCGGSSESIRFYNKLVCSTRRWFHVVVFGCPAMRTWTECRWNNTIRLSCNEIWPFHRRNSQRRSCPGRTFQSQDPDSNPLKEKKCVSIGKLSTSFTYTTSSPAPAWRWWIAWRACRRFAWPPSSVCHSTL